MATWDEVVAEAPELAEAVRARLDAGVHKTLATLRADGSPRISGTEVTFVDGDLWFGSMWQSRKALDLQRDPRFALHSASADPPEWTGDAKLSGRREEVTDPARFEALNRARGGEAPLGAPGTCSARTSRRSRWSASATRRPPRDRVLARGPRRPPHAARLRSARSRSTACALCAAAARPALRS